MNNSDILLGVAALVYVLLAFVFADFARRKFNNVYAAYAIIFLSFVILFFVLLIFFPGFMRSVKLG